MTKMTAKAGALNAQADEFSREAERLCGGDEITKQVEWFDCAGPRFWTMRHESVEQPEAMAAWRAAYPDEDYSAWFKQAAPSTDPEDAERASELHARAFALRVRATALDDEGDAADKPKRKPGPEPVHDWDFLREKAFEALDDRGQVGPHDWKQADLVSHLLAIMATLPGGECSDSLMKKKVRAWCLEWSEAVKAGRRV